MTAKTTADKGSAAYLYGRVESTCVGIETRKHRIRGKLVQYENSRFSDILNRPKNFIVL